MQNFDTELFSDRNRGHCDFAQFRFKNWITQCLMSHNHYCIRKDLWICSPWRSRVIFQSIWRSKITILGIGHVLHWTRFAFSSSFVIQLITFWKKHSSVYVVSFKIFQTFAWCTGMGLWHAIYDLCRDTIGHWHGDDVCQTSPQVVIMVLAEIGHLWREQVAENVVRPGTSTHQEEPPRARWDSGE